MITLGVITAIDNKNNFCKVRLPTLEGPGNKNQVILSATQLLPPGIGAGYEVDDVVFVSFVDNTLGRPVVLGQLYKGPGQGTKVDGIGSKNDTSLGIAASMDCLELKVHGKASIPLSTLLTSPNSTTNNITIATLLNTIKDLEQRVESLEQLVNTLKSISGVAAVADIITNN